MIIVCEKEEVLNLLYTFDDVFPHNREKVSDYEEWAEKISMYGITVVYTVDQETAGMAVFYANNRETKTGYISLIGLKKAYQGKGYGRIFLDKILEKMDASGMRKCMLEVDCDNEEAFRFYCKYGFHVKEEKENSRLMSIEWE